MSDAKKSVTRRAGIVGAGTLASRILGLVRESVIAAYFPTAAIDAYQVAFVLPNLFRRLTGEGAYSISVTTVFTKLWQKGDKQRSRDFVGAVYGFSLLFLALLTLAGVFGAQWMTSIVGWGFQEDPEKFALASRLTATLFPYVFFVSLMAMAMGILNATGRFFAPAFAPVLLNVSIIGCAVGLTGTMPSLGLHPIFALAVGVLIGGVVQVLFQLPSLKAVGLLVRPKLRLSDPALRRVLALTAPMVIGAAAYLVWNAMAKAFASTLGDGAVTYITFAERLFELPLAVLVMAISTAALPGIAGLVGENKMDEAKQVWGHALRLALLVATPAMVALLVLAEPLVTIMYQRGMFSHGDVLETAGALRWLAAGLVSVALLRQTTPFFYALERVKIPVFMSFGMIGAYAVAALYLKDIYGHRGLCMASSIAATVQGVGLLIVLRVLVGRIGLGRMMGTWMRMLVASVAMAAALWGIQLLGNWEEGGNSLRNIAILGLCVAGGLTVYVGSAYILRVEELRELLGALKRRRTR